MSYNCPNCSQPLTRRWPKLTDIAGGPGVGVGLLLFGPFFRQYDCPEHGRIPRNELADSARKKIVGLSFLWLITVLAILLGIGWGVSTMLSN